MKETRLMWDMPITIEIIDQHVDKNIFQRVYNYFNHIDSIFNTFAQNSEISRINRGEVKKNRWSDEMKEVLSLCETTSKETGGYFNHMRNGYIDPLGIVKGWAVKKASEMLKEGGFADFYIEAGGDIQANGKNWSVGIRNPFNRFENIKILSLANLGVATSGSYIRGNHIYNPYKPNNLETNIVSLTVVASNVYEADRFATAAFAMGKDGIYFIEQMSGIEGYMIDNQRMATYTSGFNNYLSPNNIINSSTQVII